MRAIGFRRYLTALVRSGWAWLLAAFLVLGNAVAAAVSVAKGDESPVVLIMSVALLGPAGWLFYRAYQLALRDPGKGGELPPQR